MKTAEGEGGVNNFKKNVAVTIFFCIFAAQFRWGISSVGRAFEWHSKGQEFDSPMLHNKSL